MNAPVDKTTQADGAWSALRAPQRPVNGTATNHRPSTSDQDKDVLVSVDVHDAAVRDEPAPRTGAKGDEVPKRPNLDEMLRCYAGVWIGSRYRFMEIDPKARVIVSPFMEKRDLLDAHEANLTTIIDAKQAPKTVAVAQLWLKHPRRLEFNRVVYDMPGSPAEWRAGPKDFNAYRGFTVQPKAGDWSKNKAHILNIICNGNEDHFHWLMNWCAALIQLPGQHGWVAIVLMGGQGIGKGHFVEEMLGRCFYPEQYIQINGANQLTEKFNDFLSGKTLIFADESTWGGDHRAVGRLKALITEKRILIERKFLPAISEPSALHTMISSNNEWPVPVDRDDRRLFVLQVSEAQKQKDAYFTPLLKELDEGGRAAMLAELLAWPVDEALLRHPPHTEAKAGLAVRSLKLVEKWWLELLQTGTLHGGEPEGVDWPTKMPKQRLISAFETYLEKHEPRSSQSAQAEVSKYVKHVLGFKTGQETIGKRQRFWEFETLVECRKAWTEQHPGDVEWNSDPEDEETAF